MPDKTNVMRLCPQCGCKFMRRIGDVNRALKTLAPLYCGKDCASAARRTATPTDVKKALKAAYDKEYRVRTDRNAKRRDAYYANHEAALAASAEQRKRRMPKHVEYCRRPEYKAYKAEYDKKRNEEEYGDWAESWRLLQELEQEIRSQATAYEIRVANGYYLRSAQKRRRELWQLKKNCNSTPAT